MTNTTEIDPTQVSTFPLPPFRHTAHSTTSSDEHATTPRCTGDKSKSLKAVNWRNGATNVEVSMHIANADDRPQLVQRDFRTFPLSKSLISPNALCFWHFYLPLQYGSVMQRAGLIAITNNRPRITTTVIQRPTTTRNASTVIGSEGKGLSPSSAFHSCGRAGIADLEAGMIDGRR